MRAGAVVAFGFTTTYAISAYHHGICYEFESRTGRCTTLCDKVCPPVSSTNKTDRHDIAEILLKMALILNTTKRTINARIV